MLHNGAVILYPAIDLRGGKCVRLRLGDFSQETVYGEDPVAVAKHFIAQGATWIHVVDLDGARSGRPEQLDIVRQIAALGTPVQMGGGIRSAASLDRALEAGVARVVVGSALVKDEAFAAWALSEHSERVAAGIDARDGLVAVSGWEEASSIRATELAHRLTEQGCRWIVFTDIARDGTLQGPNIPALEEMIAASSVSVIASGGVATLGDLEVLSTLPIDGVIVGKAIYEGQFSVAEGVAKLR